MRRFSKISTNSEQSQENKIIRDERSMKIPGLHFRENNSESDLIGSNQNDFLGHRRISQNEGLLLYISLYP